MKKSKKLYRKGNIYATYPDRASRVGLPPGSYAGISDKDLAHEKFSSANAPFASPLEIDLISILAKGSDSQLQEKTLEWREVVPLLESQAPNVYWLNFDNVDGARDSATMKEIKKYFKIDPLCLEDIITTDQRPKVEDYQEYLFLVMRMFRVEEVTKKIISEQVSFILGPHYVLSFQEGPLGDVFGSIRERMKKTENPLNKWQAGYLLYSLIDSIIDHYFVVIDSLFEEIDNLERELIAKQRPTTMGVIYQKKIEAMYLRRFISPLRECINSLLKCEKNLIGPSNHQFLRDLQDHVLHLSDSIESFRETLSFLAEFNLTLSSHTTNEIMKFLTVFTALFIPLTFITGVYGMNFEFMPELRWKYGYHFVWIMIISITTTLIFYFKKKKWLP